MGKRTVSLTDEAYDRLKSEQKDGESFSDVIIRLTAEGRSRTDIETPAGDLDPEYVEMVDETTEAVREDLEFESDGN